MAEVAITSQAFLEADEGPAEAFRLRDVDRRGGRAGAGARPQMRPLVEDPARESVPIPDYPDVTLRDAAAMREYEAARQAAE